MSLQFDARALSELPAGWARDYIFYANGWVKDGDFNTKFSETLEPLPFHGMSAYPYSRSEAFVRSPQDIHYLGTWNTRPARNTVGPLPGAQGQE